MDGRVYPAAISSSPFVSVGTATSLANAMKQAAFCVCVGGAEREGCLGFKWIDGIDRGIDVVRIVHHGTDRDGVILDREVRPHPPIDRNGCAFQGCDIHVEAAQLVAVGVGPPDRHLVVDDERS